MINKNKENLNYDKDIIYFDTEQYKFNDIIFNLIKSRSGSKDKNNISSLSEIHKIKISKSS